MEKKRISDERLAELIPRRRSPAGGSRRTGNARYGAVHPAGSAAA